LHRDSNVEHDLFFLKPASLCSEATTTGHDASKPDAHGDIVAANSGALQSTTAGCHWSVLLLPSML
jgi:hypothetical protein